MITEAQFDVRWDFFLDWRVLFGKSAPNLLHDKVQFKINWWAYLANIYFQPPLQLGETLNLLHYSRCESTSLSG